MSQPTDEPSFTHAATGAPNPHGGGHAKPGHFVPLPRKIAWGVGGLTVDLINAIWSLAMPIYSLGLGVPAVWIGVALAIPRIWDAISDPLMGHISDQTRSRWGRRRPYIFVGAIGLGICFAALWMPSRAWGHVSLLGWFIAISILFFTFSTIWNIPWTAFGLELTPDVRERNNVQAVRGWFATGSAFIIPAILPLAFHFGRGDEVAGIRWVGLIIGGLMAACAISAVVCREVAPTAPPSKISLWKSAKTTFKNRPFLYLSIYAALFTGGLMLVGQMGYYINVFYVFAHLPIEQAKKASSEIGFWGGLAGATINLAVIPLIALLANRIGKKATLLAGIGMVFAACLSNWFLITPRSPYLQILLPLVSIPGVAFTWTLIPSMLADICDVDELETGERREGMFISIGAYFVWKYPFDERVIESVKRRLVERREQP